MLTKKTKRAKGATGTTNGQPPSYRESLARRLGKVAGIEVVYIMIRGDVVHVCSVMAEHESRIFKSLIKQENLVEKDHPDITFDFHTRVHQGRPLNRVVPTGADVVFSR
jgi:hypothetical protein